MGPTRAGHGGGRRSSIEQMSDMGSFLLTPEDLRREIPCTVDWVARLPECTLESYPVACQNPSRKRSRRCCLERRPEQPEPFEAMLVRSRPHRIARGRRTGRHQGSSDISRPTRRRRPSWVSL